LGLSGWPYPDASRLKRSGQRNWPTRGQFPLHVTMTGI
jgi:hypothetical protein